MCNILASLSYEDRQFVQTDELQGKLFNFSMTACYIQHAVSSDSFLESQYSYERDSCSSLLNISESLQFNSIDYFITLVVLSQKNIYIQGMALLSTDQLQRKILSFWPTYDFSSLKNKLVHKFNMYSRHEVQVTKNESLLASGGGGEVGHEFVR